MVDLNKVRLGIGINNLTGYCYTILEQIGIPGFYIRSLEEGLREGIRIFFWNEHPEVLKSLSEKYNEIKFAVFTTHDFTGKLLDRSVTEQNSILFKTKISGGSDYCFYFSCNVFQLKGASEGISINISGEEIKDSGILRTNYKNIILVSFPWDFINFSLGTENSFRPYYSESTQKNFVEIGPPVDLGKFRVLVLDQLIKASNILELPLIAKKSPFQKKKYFSVRIDADGYHKDSIIDVLRVSKFTGLQFTWFIDVRGWQNNLDSLKLLNSNNQSVQLHCYTHMTYDSELLNEVNIKKGHKILKKYGINAEGIVSPNGFYTKGFGKAISKLGFKYSSEFGFNVDDLPSWPENEKSNPLQIPVHPGSFGVFLSSGFEEADIFQHLNKIIDERAEQNSLAVIYEHPYYFFNRSSKWADFLKGILDKGYQYINMSEIYEVWKKYSEFTFDAIFDKSTSTLNLKSDLDRSKLMQLNSLKHNESDSISHSSYFSKNKSAFRLIDNELISKEIDSRKYILENISTSIPSWFIDYYWFKFRVFILNTLKRFN